MMVKLNMSVVGQPGLSLTDIVPGLLCSASSIIDKRWYRAVVISAHDGSGGVSLCDGRGGGRRSVCVGGEEERWEMSIVCTILFRASSHGH